jgi:hypothetical protein
LSIRYNLQHSKNIIKISADVLLRYEEAMIVELVVSMPQTRRSGV